MGQITLTVDHFIPLERNGKNDMSNYISACRGCNTDKGRQSPEEFCKDRGYDYEGYKIYLKAEYPSELMIFHLSLKGHRGR
jgi:5-methylcytosine-specific restriction endonuclease McrA